MRRNTCLATTLELTLIPTLALRILPLRRSGNRRGSTTKLNRLSGKPNHLRHLVRPVFLPPLPTSLLIHPDDARCNRQIAASDLLQKHADVTRSTVQKAVVVLASRPVFVSPSVRNREWRLMRDGRCRDLSGIFNQE